MTVSKTTTQEKARELSETFLAEHPLSERVREMINHKTCSCHECTQARWKGSLQRQLEAALLNSNKPPADSLTAELQKENARQKQALDMLREMAEAKPDMKLVGAAAVILGMLQPLTESDIKRGQEIAALLVENERLTAELRGISAASNTSWLADRARRAISPKGGTVQQGLSKEKE